MLGIHWYLPLTPGKKSSFAPVNERGCDVGKLKHSNVMVHGMQHKFTKANLFVQSHSRSLHTHPIIRYCQRPQLVVQPACQVGRMSAHSNHGGRALALEASGGLCASADETICLAGARRHGDSSGGGCEEGLAVIELWRTEGVDAQICCRCGYCPCCCRTGGGGGSDADEEKATLEATDEDSASGELYGDCSGFQGIPRGEASLIPLIASFVAILMVVVALSSGWGLRAGQRRGQNRGRGRVDGEERSGDGGVGAEEGDGLGACVGEELAGRGGDEEGGDLRGAVRS